MILSKQAVATFQETVWSYYFQHQRDLPWRAARADGAFNAYKIMVSEIMLQQTQVARVVPKYHQFLALFPDVASLAHAPLGDVLVAWNGLGYNRRAKFLWQAAVMVESTYGGQLPTETSKLQKLPGIGVNTAAAIAAYAYNQPVVFIETNIRTVFIHHFFADQDGVTDKQILELVAQTLPLYKGKRAAQDFGSAKAWRDEKKPQVLSHYREWYWGLMDYGTHLKTSFGNVGRSSKHYTKQSKFEGSNRQIRGQIIRLLSEKPCSLLELSQRINDDRLQQVVASLGSEQLIKSPKKDHYSL